MARITGYVQGNVSDEGKVNWRGDQVAAVQGGQSIMDSSSVLLADLGSRKVVGDRVFRYAQAGAANLAAGDCVGVNPVTDAAVTAGGLGFAGDKVFTYYSSASRAADFFAEGYLMCKTATDGNEGMLYRIKSHSAMALTTNATLQLYDPLAISVLTSGAGLWFCVANMYKSQVAATGGVQPVHGVCPIVVSSSEYFWMQTWGPASVRASAGTAGVAMIVGVTGAAGAFVQSNTVNASQIIGVAMSAITASTKGLVFLQIAP